MIITGYSVSRVWQTHKEKKLTGNASVKILEPKEADVDEKFEKEEEKPRLTSKMDSSCFLRNENSNPNEEKKSDENSFDLSPQDPE